MPQEIGKQYKELLRQYLNGQNEKDLYYGQQFSRQFIEKNIAPEDVIGIHQKALSEVLPELTSTVEHSFDFLIEMMIHYGLALQEHQSLIRKQEELQLEMNVATKVQDTLLKTEQPNFKGIDIGMVSVPAKEMNGDYVYFLNDGGTEACVAVADVMGKGIPAALCMSMIKFGMDGLKGTNKHPRKVLNIVNRIVEKSVDDSMFISMFYGQYDPSDSSFSYASAGHEPALMYDASKNAFTELNAKGLLLGVQKEVLFEEHSVVLDDGDFVAIMTDGVTEARTDNGFIEEELIQTLLLEERASCAQVMADKVYSRLLEMQNFHLRDDFTLVIFKKDPKKV